MAISVTHSTVVVTPDDGTSEVGSDEWNAAHTVTGAVADTLTLTAGDGLTGGGDLSANRTFTVGAGTGITVNADDVALTIPVAVSSGGTGQTTEAEAVGELIQALTADATPDPALDFVGTYDASADTGKKVSIDNLITAAESTIESVIDTLANLTSIQGLTVTLADAGADAVLGWDDSAGAYENLTATEVLEIIKTVDGAGSGLDADLLDGQSSAAFQAADATLTALAAYNTNGLVTQTAADTFTGRTITGTASEIEVGDGDGVAGNPTIGLTDAVAITTSLTIAGNTAWHAGNDGAASGLDADLLDGKNTGTSGNAVPLLDGTNTWSGQQTITLGSAATTEPLRLVNTTDNASVQVAQFEGDRATMADNDEAYVSLLLSNDGGTQTEFARLTWVATDVNAGTSVDGRLDFAVVTAGSLADEMQLDGAALSPSTNDGLALGTTSLGWADLHLATGGVINWANGEVTITETDANTLTVAGATAVSLGTSAAFTTGTIELGAASDTTIARSGAGDITIEGNAVYRAGGTDVALADGGTGASLADPNADRLLGWDDSAGATKFFALTDFTDEAAPAAGDYVIIYGAEGDMRRANWSTLPGVGGGISNVVEDTSPELGGDLESNNFDIIMEQYSADAVDAEILFSKSRNASIGSHTVVQDGDDLGRVVFRGSDGTNFEEAAYVLGEVDGTPGNNDMPGRLTIWTTPDASATPAERVRVDNAGRVNIGAGAPPASAFSITGQLNLNPAAADANLVLNSWNASTIGSGLILAASKNNTVGSHTVLANGDFMSAIYFAGSDGTGFIQGGAITAAVDGTPGTNDMPGRVSIWTTADGASGSTERLRITNSGRLIAMTSGQVAHFWVYWTANSTTILASHNVTSIDDDAVGDAGVNLTTAFSSNNYAAHVTTNDTTNGWDAEEVQSSGINVHTAGVVDVLCATITDGGTAATSLTDPDQWQVSGFGVSA